MGNEAKVAYPALAELTAIRSGSLIDWDRARTELTAAENVAARLADLEGIDQACDAANRHVVLLQDEVNRLRETIRSLGEALELYDAAAIKFIQKCVNGRAYSTETRSDLTVCLTHSEAALALAKKEGA